MASEIRFKRRVSGAPGAPATLGTAEPAYNMADGFLRIGFGDNGSGVGTTIKTFGKDDFLVNIPAGGTTGQVLAKSSNSDGAVSWQTISAGATYTAGTGLSLNTNQFSVNTTVIAALASPAFTGTPTAPTPADADNSTKLATTAYVTSKITALLGGASAAYDTFIELQALMEADNTETAGIITSLGEKLVKSANLSDLTNTGTARTNLGLGTMATQAASAVAITGGTINGVVIDGGTW